MRHYEQMRDALRNDPQALIFLDAAQVAKQAFGLAMLAVRPPVPARSAADFCNTICQKRKSHTTPLSAKSSGRKTKIGSPTQLHACLFGRNVSVGLRDVIDARVAVVDGQQSGIGRRIDVNGRII